jgi:glycosyltransferase involved in cell wall biosynthesis
MNVLHVHSGNLYGGVETFLLTLARSRELAPGMDMSVALCFEGRLARDLHAARMMPVMLGEVRLRRPDRVRRARQELRSLLATHAFDIAVCHQAWPHAVFGSVLKGAGIPLVSWVHMAQTGGHWLDRLAGRIEPDCFFCNSKYTASLLPPTNARIEVVYYPVAPASALDDRSLRRDKPNAPSLPIVIIQVSRMEAWKGQRVLLEALAQLRDAPEWECGSAAYSGRPKRY